ARVRRLAQRHGTIRPRPAGRLRASNESLTGTLTPRERETLILLARGHKQREIAAALSIGEKTVATHLQRVLEKLGVHSRAHAVAIAYQDGLLADGATAGALG